MHDVAPVDPERDDSLFAAWGSVVAPQAREPDLHIAAEWPELDGHRAVAVLAVVVFHVFQFCTAKRSAQAGGPGFTVLNSLDAAVPWLFVITAFLVFEPIARAAVDGGPRFSARRFLTHRAFRLIPVYYVAVTVVWLLRQSRLPGDWRDLIEHLTFTQVFDGKRIFYTIGPAWAVSVTVFFYLALTVVSIGALRICHRREHRRHRIAVLTGAIAVLAVVSLGWKEWAFTIGHRPVDGSFPTWFGPVANLDNFAVGMAVALIAVAGRASCPLGRRETLALRIAAILTLAVAVAARTSGGWSMVFFPVFCSVGFGALVAAAVLGPASRGLWARLFGSATLRRLGVISFSVYLWHAPLILVLHSVGAVRQDPQALVRDAILVLIGSILVGQVSYTLIEQPTRRLGDLFERQHRAGADPVNCRQSTKNG